MIQVITVEREYGSQGADFAHHLAERLGWKLIDSCLIEDVARKAGVAPTLVKRFDERVDPWYHRFGKAIWLAWSSATSATATLPALSGKVLDKYGAVKASSYAGGSLALTADPVWVVAN